jgi:hypothetical protein
MSESPYIISPLSPVHVPFESRKPFRSGASETLKFKVTLILSAMLEINLISEPSSVELSKIIKG